MGQVVTYGAVTLRNDLAFDQAEVKFEPQWSVDVPTVREGPAFARGKHLQLKRVSFNMLARFSTDLLREAFKLTLWEELHPSGDYIAPRTLSWTNPATTAGLAVAEPPEIVDEGHDGIGLILVVRYKFLVGFTAPSANKILFGELKLDGNTAYQIFDYKVNPQWQNVIEASFRGLNPYGLGTGNFSNLVEWGMVSRFSTVMQREMFKLQIGKQLHPLSTVVQPPRALSFVFPHLGTSFPISAGNALAQPPEFGEEGFDGTYYILHTRMKFHAGLNPRPELEQPAA